MSINPWITNSFVDTCAFDPKYHPEAEAANEIFRLHKEEGLGILLAHSNQKEVDHPNTPACVKAEAARLIYTVEGSLTGNERELSQNIQSVLMGQGRPEKVKKDARHIFEAHKYGSYFVTTDAGILKHAGEIRAICSVQILLPSQFLEVVQNHNRPHQG